MGFSSDSPKISRTHWFRFCLSSFIRKSLPFAKYSSILMCASTSALRSSFAFSAACQARFYIWLFSIGGKNDFTRQLVRFPPPAFKFRFFFSATRYFCALGLQVARTMLISVVDAPMSTTMYCYPLILLKSLILLLRWEIVTATGYETIFIKEALKLVMICSKVFNCANQNEGGQIRVISICSLELIIVWIIWCISVDISNTAFSFLIFWSMGLSGLWAKLVSKSLGFVAKKRNVGSGFSFQNYSACSPTQNCSPSQAIKV